MKLRFLYLSALSYIFASCEAKCPNREKCSIAFQNNSTQTVVVGYSESLPDTSLYRVDFRLTGGVEPKEQYFLGGHWKTRVKDAPSGKLMFVIVSTDTVSKYGIDSVLAKDMVLKRYQLSLADFEQANWTINFP